MKNTVQFMNFSFIASIFGNTGEYKKMNFEQNTGGLFLKVYLERNFLS